jgi:hypothetical protein
MRHEIISRQQQSLDRNKKYGDGDLTVTVTESVSQDSKSSFQTATVIL